MNKYLIINGPNLNLLGSRDASVYGSKTLAALEAELASKAEELGVEVEFFQSNSEGAIIDFIQANAPGVQGIVINPGALAHYSYSLREAIADSRLPVIEVHISNIYARESWRQHSVTAGVVRGQITGLGSKGYLVALEVLVSEEGET